MDDELAVLHSRFDLLQAPASGRRLLRPLVALLRRLLRPVLDRQSAYNGANARLTSELLSEIRALRAELQAAGDAGQERLQTGLDQTREVFELQHNTLTKETRASLHALRGEIATERHRQAALLASVRDQLVGQVERLGHELGDEDGEATPSATAAAGADRSDGGDNSADDAFYAALTRRLRGPEELITERLRVYLPTVREAATTTEAPVVEIGSGRGEWLKLLRVEDIPGRGIDLNPVMVADCVAQGLDVVAAEGLAHLRGLADASCAAVVAFHVIEHMPFADLVELLRQARRVLAPGGVAIFETPNPANLVVGACNFHCDPTHVRPLPSPLARALAEETGFAGVEILELHPDDDQQLPQPASRFEEEVNRLFFGCKDYAVIGRR